VFYLFCIVNTHICSKYILEAKVGKWYFNVLIIFFDNTIKSFVIINFIVYFQFYVFVNLMSFMFAALTTAVKFFS